MKKCLLAVMVLACALHARDYTYTEHFPVLPQPWYFAYPGGMDVGPGGNIYVAHNHNRVSVFSPDGVFLRQYRFMVSMAGEIWPRSIEALAVDPSGNMYLADAQESALVKADPQGNIVNKFYNFYLRGDLETDAQGNVYFADTTINDGLPGPMYPTIIKFDPQGNILLSFVASQSPTGLGLDAQGNIYVAATYYQIIKFDPQGNFLGSFGEYGENPGQLDYPKDVEIDPQGNLYVKDTIPYRIQKFSSNFAFIAQWGTQGTEPGQFYGIRSIKMAQNKLFTFEGNSRIQAFDLNGNFISIWQSMGHGANQFWNPKRVWVDNPGNVYVCDTGNHRVQKFDRKWNPDIVIGSEGTEQGQFKNPSGVYVDDEGNIYVADTDNSRVQKFDKKGQFLLQWGTKGVGNGQFETLADIDGDNDGNVYTLDYSLRSIQKFTRNGQFVMRFKVQSPDGSTDVRGFGVSNTGLIYVVGYPDEVNVYDTQGNYVDNLNYWEILGFPLDVAFSPTGEFFVADSKKGVAQFNPDGTFVAYLAAGNDVLKDVYAPTGVSVHNTGRLYICEEANGRVLVYEPKAGLKMTVPAAASIHGALGTDWRTDLSIFNPGFSAMDVTLDYYKADGALSSSFTIQPSTFLSLPDVIGTTFNAPNTFGALTAVCLNDDQPLIFSRTYNQLDGAANSRSARPGADQRRPGVRVEPSGFTQPGPLNSSQGTYGQGIRGSPYEDTFYQGETAYLTGLKSTAAFRSNVGFFNLQDIPIEVQLVLYDEAGGELASTSYPLAALSHLQVNNLFSSLSLSGDHEAAWARVWTDTLWGRFAAYGSIVDNRTGDPVYLEAKPLGGYLPEDFHWILPAVASTPGAYGTNWRTEAVFTNSLLESNEITLTYHPATGGDPFIETFTLEPGEVKSYSDFLGEAFALTESFGWLEIDSSCAGLQARARIFTDGAADSRADRPSADERRPGVRVEPSGSTPLGGRGEALSRPAEILLPGPLDRSTGTYGQGLQAQQRNTLSLGTSPVYLLNLLENENYRSNLGLLNLADTETIFTLDLLKDAAVVSSKTLTLPAQTLQQLNGVLSSFFGTSGDGFTVRITGPEGAAYTAYLSTVDNRTGDAIYQAYSTSY
jgi:sugar lactone lactonase YvrE